MPLIPWQVYQSRQPYHSEMGTWLYEYQRMNVAVVTGAVSGIIVIDCDSACSVSTIERMLTVPTTTVRSSRGKHFYFAHPGEPVQNVEGLLTDVDVRGDGGYVLAAGSLHPSGCIYEWLIPPWIASPAPLPDELRAMIIARSSLKSQIVQQPGILSISASRHRRGTPILLNEIQRLRSIPLQPGNAKQRAMAASSYRMGQLVAGGYLDADQVREAFMQVWCEWWNKAIAQGERTINYGLTSGAHNPRSL